MLSQLSQALALAMLPALTGAQAHGPAMSGAPDLLLLDADHLMRVRQALQRRDARYMVALEALVTDADRALAMEPVSVVQKAVTPPSGDKHDYMSQAPYWWPDPGSADGKPYIRRDGERNPEINRISDHDNFGRVTRSVSTLALAYFFTGHEAYAAQASRLVRAWFLAPGTRMNPHLRFGQGIPGITDGRGIGIIETRSLPELLDAVTLIGGSRSWTATDHDQLTSWVATYLAWLVDSPHGRDEAKQGNNHETWYDVQVASFALFTGKRDQATRVVEAARDRIRRQIAPDGRQPRELERTRAWDYSVFNLTAFFQLATLGDRVGVDLWNAAPDGRSLRAALDRLVPFATNGRPWPHKQITTFRPQALGWLLRRAAVAWREPRYAALAERLGGATPRELLTMP
jgi:Alginate lyase